MRTIWDADRQREIRARIAALTPDRRAQWGAFTAPKMVCHLADSLRMTLGELPVAPRKMPIRYPPLKQLIIYVAPFPKSAPTAEELLARVPAEWNADVVELTALLDRLIARGPRAEWVDHPAFGHLSSSAVGVLVYRHMDHHLRQFGV
jgi:uncharacterized protein DUF1569